MIWFLAAKEVLLDLFLLSRDALHIHIGLAIYFAAHWVFRCKLGSLLPIGILLIISLIGEVLDARILLQTGSDLHLAENLRDIWNTLLWPLMFTAFWRWRRNLNAQDQGTLNE